MALYNDRMYFGTRNYMQWVVAPKINYEASKRGYVSAAGFVNGGQFVRRSASAAKGYNLSWELKPRDEIRTINDYADGVYGTGPIYFLEPFAMDKNLLPQYWATPALGAVDAPLLAGVFDDERPALSPTPLNTLGYPSNAATYTLAVGTELSSVFIPVPPGYSLWVGAHGSRTGTAGVQITPTTGPTTTAAPLDVPLLLATNATRLNTSINGDTYRGGIISLKGVGTVALYGLMAQVLRNGTLPATGGFISGQGHSGCSFAEEPTLTNYSVALDKVGLSVNLVETEGWK
jgi:hypothetical protein